ncbi:MAG: DUF1801 domain-containing protein [Bacteroidia bacterium]
MAANKTVETKASVAGFLKSIKDEKRRRDCSAIVDLIAKHTGLEAKMWGTAIIGFGSYHYTYDSGREGDAPMVGLSSRANAISLYIPNFDSKEELLKKFGKHKTSKGCVYIQSLDDVDTGVLAKMAKNSIAYWKKKYPTK